MKFIEVEYKMLLEDGKIDNSLYDKYDVKRGLRNSNGTGVLVGLTKVSDVHGYKLIDGKKCDDEGHLYYRDIDLYDLANKDEDVYGYEKTVFLLLFGHLPSKYEFEEFLEMLKDNLELPSGFVETVIFKNPAKNLMNSLQRSILSLYSFDDDPDTQDPMKLIVKGISLIAKMPAIIAYSYQAKHHFIDNESLHIHYVNKSKSLAEQILYLVRDDCQYSELEAETLDTALIVHADHGGGNNSTFSNVVVSSTGTDLYSSISAGLGSLKGPRHGGANQMVMEMFDAILAEIGENATDEEIEKVVNKILKKDFFDNSGLIYGIGHAVYTISDPRCILLKEKCKALCEEKGRSKLFDFYARFEEIACRRLKEVKGNVYCANVDFYSGLTYSMLNIPRDLFTPIFATARITGWIAHIIEAILYCNKIIRPASLYVGHIKEEKKD